MEAEKYLNGIGTMCWGALLTPIAIVNTTDVAGNTMKTYRNYKGVKIYREVEVMPTFDVIDGVVKERKKPRKDEQRVWFFVADGYCKDDHLLGTQNAIDDCFALAHEHGIDEATMVRCLNMEKEFQEMEDTEDVS